MSHPSCHDVAWKPKVRHLKSTQRRLTHWPQLLLQHENNTSKEPWLFLFQDPHRTFRITDSLQANALSETLFGKRRPKI